MTALEEYPIRRVLAFWYQGTDQEFHRYKSWDHCFAHFRGFREFRDDPEKLDVAALHLAFFLASWGMFRGSSPLLQKDYKFFLPVVKVLLQPRFDALWEFDFMGGNLGSATRLIFESGGLRDQIERALCSPGESVWASYTLSSKIMLGTLCCAPAYDWYLKRALSRFSMTQQFNPRSYGQVVQFYRVNEDAFTQGPATTVDYPPMKLADMYFWQVGFLAAAKDDPSAKGSKELLDAWNATATA